MNARRPSDALPSGTYAIVDGEELRIFSTVGKQGFTLLSNTPRDGFVEDPYGRYLRDIPHNEQLECVKYSTRGSYRGLDVWAIPNRVGTLVLYPNVGFSPGSATPDEAEAAGFENQGRPSEWIKVVEPDDPDLDVVTTRTPIDPPWFKRGKEAGS